MLKRLSFIFVYCLLICSINAQTQSKQSDYCKSVVSPKYDEKIIKTTAVLFFPPEGEAMNEPNHASVFFYKSGCNNKDYFAMAEFSQTKDWDFVNNLATSNSKPNQPTMVQLEFKGKLSMSFIRSFGQYAWLRAEITVNKINSAKVVEYSLPDFDVKAPMIEAGEFVVNFNANFMISFYGRGLSKIQLEDILTSNSKITINKQKISKKEFFNYSENDRGGTIGVRIRNVKKNNNAWRIQGEITHILKDKPPIIRKYDNKYLVDSNNSIRLIYSKIE